MPHLNVYVDKDTLAKVQTAAKMEGRPIRVNRHGAGDGTVLRSSALLDERMGPQGGAKLRTPIQWKSIIFANSGHMALTRDRVIINNLLFRLQECSPGQSHIG